MSSSAKTLGDHSGKPSGRHAAAAPTPRGRPAASLPSASAGSFARWGGVLALVAALVWSYWPVLRPLYRDWQGDQNYSICQLVPLAALWLIWRERARLARLELTPCWWGIGVILLAQAALAYGLIYLFESAERYSLVVMILGMVLLCAGWRVFWQAKWALLLLFLMVPLPGRIHNLISDPLQSLSTQGALVVLELVGITTLREGHVLLLNGHTAVAVAEACSGLRMLTAFVVVAYVFACVINRPPWQKFVLALSSIPIAILSNLVRLVVTALLFLVTSNETAESFFHDFAGLTLMPIAFLVMLGELWIMARLVTVDEPPSTLASPGKSAAQRGYAGVAHADGPAGKA